MRIGRRATPFSLEDLGPRPHIVVVVRDHMSGVLYSIPALRAIRKRWPDARVTLLSSSYAIPVLGGRCPYGDQILPLYTFADEPRRFGRLRDMLRVTRTWLRLVGRVDLVIHLRHVGDSTLAFCASLGLPPQIGFQQGRLDRLLTIDLGPSDGGLGSRQRNRVILERAGIEPDGDHMELWISEDDQRWARSWLHEHGHRSGDHLTIAHPGSHWGCNQWLEERWAETVRRVLAEREGTVVITGSGRERPMAERIAGEIKGPVIVAAGETGLSEYAALLAEADLVIGVDSAPTQVCQALDVPAVIMMGAGNPTWNGPVAGERMVMLQEWDNDNPRPEVCDWASGACNGPQCSSRLEDISVTQVLDSVEQLLESPEHHLR